MHGDYTGATISYINALEKKSYKEWIYYNLGNVYNALGETKAAEEELLRATKTDYPEVVFRTHFNLGNIYLKNKNYFGIWLQAKGEDMISRGISLNTPKNIFSDYIRGK